VAGWLRSIITKTYLAPSSEGPDSSVGYGLADRRIWISFSAEETRPDSPWGPPWVGKGKSDRGVKLTTHFHLVPKLDISGVMPPIPITSSLPTRTTLPLTLLSCLSSKCNNTPSGGRLNCSWFWFWKSHAVSVGMCRLSDDGETNGEITRSEKVGCFLSDTRPISTARDCSPDGNLPVPGRGPCPPECSAYDEWTWGGCVCSLGHTDPQASYNGLSSEEKPSFRTLRRAVRQRPSDRRLLEGLHWTQVITERVM
jgi:hypothetical protein